VVSRHVSGRGADLKARLATPHVPKHHPVEHRMIRPALADEVVPAVAIVAGDLVDRQEPHVRGIVEHPGVGEVTTDNAGRRARDVTLASRSRICSNTPPRRTSSNGCPGSAQAN
jgi:hypothetical protein